MITIAKQNLPIASNFRQMPECHPIFRMTEQNPQIFEAFQTVENDFLFAICAFEMGGDLGGCPFAALGAK